MKSRQIGPPALVALVLICCVGCVQQKSGTLPNTVSAADQVEQMKTDLNPSRVLKLGGVLRDHNGKRLTGVMGVLFAVYEQQEGGAPLWQEVQNVQADAGRFTALVGSTKSGGILPELFGTGKALWLGWQVMLPDEVEHPRIRLVSTPSGRAAQRGAGSVAPANSDDQPAAAENRQPSEQPADSPKDESVNSPSRSNLRLHRRRLVP